MKVYQNYSLKPYHTFGIDVRAKYFAGFTSVEELETLLTAQGSETLLLLGGGSNVLFVKDYPGLVLKNNIDFIEIADEDESNILLKVGAGVNWHRFVMHCVENNFGGVENLSLIPGNAGASPMQNIGAYGVEIKDVFYELEAYDLEERSIRKFFFDDCEFGYRESVFKRKYKGRFVILNVTYRLQKTPVFNISYGTIQDELNRVGITDLNIKAISDAIINIRTSKLPDPGKIGNAGSFFKNPVISNEHFEQLKSRYTQQNAQCEISNMIPGYRINNETVKIPAAWLIEQCGYKGFRQGDAGCYPRQPLVLVNYGQATGKEIYDLGKKIIHSVGEQFGIILEPEVNIIQEAI